MHDSPIVVGIVGDSASGKSTIANGLVRILGEHRVARVNCDDYHRFTRAQRLKEGVSQVHADGYYLDIIDQHLSLLKRGEPVLKPVVDPATENFLAPEYIVPKPVVLVEGSLGYASQAMRAQYDMKLFLEPADEVRIKWKIRHDTRRFARSEAAVVKELAQLKSDEGTFVRPQSKWADMVVRFAPSEEHRDDIGSLLGASVLLRPTLPDAGVYELLRRVRPPTAIRMELDRDMGLPVDRLVIEGGISMEQCAPMVQALWAEINPGERRPLPAGVADIPSDQGAASQSNALVLTLLLVALHVSKLDSGRAVPTS